jgi:hypothetical protein
MCKNATGYGAWDHACDESGAQHASLDDQQLEPKRRPRPTGQGPLEANLVEDLRSL